MAPILRYIRYQMTLKEPLLIERLPDMKTRGHRAGILIAVKGSATLLLQACRTMVPFRAI